MPLNIGSTAGGSVTLSSGSTASATTLTLPAVNGTVLTTATTLTVAQGGTGAATLAANNVLLGNGTSALQTVAPGTSGNLLTSNGTTWASSAPQEVIPAGTNMLFFQVAAPTGWTQFTAASDRALRVVSGAGGGIGGSIIFSTMFTGAYPVGSTAITEAQMPSHIHGVTDPGHFHTIPAGGSTNVGGPQGTGSGPAPANPSTSTVATGITIDATGSSQGHDHTIPELAYADVIICTKN